MLLMQLSNAWACQFLWFFFLVLHYVHCGSWRFWRKMMKNLGTGSKGDSRETGGSIRSVTRKTGKCIWDCWILAQATGRSWEPVCYPWRNQPGKTCLPKIDTKCSIFKGNGTPTLEPIYV
jgi:hypothetical protein